MAASLGALLRAGALPLADVIDGQLRDPVPARPVDLAAFTPDLGSYDALLTEAAS